MSVSELQIPLQSVSSRVTGVKCWLFSNRSGLATGLSPFSRLSNPLADFQQ
jgi:hypothetical protein